MTHSYSWFPYHCPCTICRTFSTGGRGYYVSHIGGGNELLSPYKVLSNSHLRWASSWDFVKSKIHSCVRHWNLHRKNNMVVFYQCSFPEIIQAFCMLKVHGPWHSNLIIVLVLSSHLCLYYSLSAVWTTCSFLEKSILHYCTLVCLATQLVLKIYRTCLALENIDPVCVPTSKTIIQYCITPSIPKPFAFPLSSGEFTAKIEFGLNMKSHGNQV